MRIILTLLLLAFCLPTQGANVYFHFQNLVTANPYLSELKLIPTNAPTVNAGVMVIANSHSTRTDTNGAVTVSNVVPLTYHWLLTTKDGYQSDGWITLTNALTDSSTVDFTTIGTTRTNNTGSTSTAYDKAASDARFYLNSNPSNFLTAFTNSAALVADPSGSDTTGTRGRTDKPFLTLSAAKTAAASGDTVFVNPGSYTANDLLKNGVNLQFSPGANINFTADSAFSIFDDKGVGITNLIGGLGDFNYAGPDSGFDTAGVIKTSHSNSVIRLSANKLTAASANAIVGSVAPVWIQDCKLVEVNVNDIENADANETSSIYWVHGETHVNANRIRSGSYVAIFGGADTGYTTATSLYVTAHSIEATNSDAIWYEATTAFGRMWITCEELISSGGEGVVNFYSGPGRLYITAQKINDQGNVFGAIKMTDFSAQNLGQLWVTSEKISSGAMFATIGNGTTHMTAQHYEDTGGMTVGFTITGGTNYIHGGEMKIRNGKGFNISGGVTLIENMTIDTSATDNTNNAPIFISGGTVKLRNCTLIAPASAFSINSSNAQTVKIYGSVAANRTNNVNITRSPSGTFTIDSNIQ